ncbi:hypothetical protein [Nannocystis pusilla]|uniref:Tetratricopeptide repeat protein n=1 Tax=Nannocystis pusilla TaxID=889268 RepID=A0ABS7TMJ2_9BACT|nr:hypothetical protein [Nannocystis pusilla]MBZ5709405.1 hypothetical protein [Nannocystis pusilla]
MTEAMEEFVRQDDYRAMVLSADDDDLLYPLKALDGLDRDSEHAIYLTFAHEFRASQSWVDEVVRGLLGQIEAAAAMQADKRVRVERGDEHLEADRVYALDPWRRPPPAVTDSRRDPVARFHALLTHVDALVPAGDYRVVWSLMPLKLLDPGAYTDFVVRLLQPELAPRHRLFIRDNRVAPVLVPRLEQLKVKAVLAMDLDFSPERMHDDLVASVADRSKPPQQRILGLFQLAAVDLAYKRYADALAKYAAVYEYFEGKEQPGMQALCLSGAGEVADAQGDHHAALARHRQALALVAPTGVLPLMLNPMLGAGRSALRIGDYAEAEVYLGNAAELARKGLNHTACCDALHDKGRAQLGGGKPTEAVASWRQAATLAATFEYHDGQRKSLTALIEQHERAGRQADAAKARHDLTQVGRRAEPTSPSR